MAVRLRFSFPARLFWNRRFQQSRGQLVQSVASMLGAIGREKRSCEYARLELASVRKLVRGLHSDLQKLSPRTPGEALEFIGAFQKRVAILNIRLLAITEEDQTWAGEIQRLRDSSRSLLRRAATVPGKSFQKECSALSLQIDRGLAQAGAAKRRQELKTVLRQADDAVRRFDEQVTSALAVREEFLTFQGRVKQLDTEEVSLNVAVRESYESLLLSTQSISDDIKAGRYSQAARRLGNARRLESTIVSQVNRRFELARVEIGLWLDDPLICERFGLREFSTHFGAANVAGWVELREKIEKVVTLKAKEVQKNNAAFLGRINKGLAYVWDSDPDARKLLSFAKAVAGLSSEGPAER